MEDRGVAFVMVDPHPKSVAKALECLYEVDGRGDMRCYYNIEKHATDTHTTAVVALIAKIPVEMASMICDVSFRKERRETEFAAVLQVAFCTEPCQGISINVPKSPLLALTTHEDIEVEERDALKRVLPEKEILVKLRRRHKGNEQWKTVCFPANEGYGLNQEFTVRDKIGELVREIGSTDNEGRTNIARFDVYDEFYMLSVLNGKEETIRKTLNHFRYAEATQGIESGVEYEIVDYNKVLFLQH